MAKPSNFSAEVLEIDAEREIERITSGLRNILSTQLKRRGLVVALSGGIDSSVTLALAAKAVGHDRVLALLLPEQHSAPDTLHLSRTVAEFCQAPYQYEDISRILDAVGFYRRYDEAVRQALPAYGEGWKSKLVIRNIMESKGFNYFSIVARDPENHEHRKRLTLKAYLGIVAATNFKQRIRKMMEYYYADRYHYAVAGTPNRLEYDQGFFVKLGDGAADVKPIAHLYKTQVYRLAAYLELPDEIIQRPSSTDTYQLPQSQDEFYFSLPHDKMDLCLYAKNNDIPLADVAKVAGLTVDQVQRVFDDIDTKRSTTRYLHLPAQLIQAVPEIGWESAPARLDF